MHGFELRCGVLIGLLTLVTVAPGWGQATARSAALEGIGRLDPTPAATVMLPYFEVDLGNPMGVTTLFTVHNADAADHIAHVVVWSDLGVPVIDFNIYLTGYDAAPLNLRDLLSGFLPFTAPPDVQAGVSPVGPLSVSDPELDTASCAGQLPPAPLPTSFVSYMQDALTGQPSVLFGGDCFGVDHGDQVARGYLTIDVVRSCSLLFPGDPGYFADGGQGVATNDNVLWGDFQIVEPAADRALSAPLVHVEAHGSVSDGFWAAGDPTFYGTYVSGTAIDNREPLAFAWVSPYVGGGLAFDDTDLVWWRDPGREVSSFVCGNLPAPFPRGQRTALVFDEQEDFVDRSDTAAFQWAVTRASVELDLVSPFSAGWVLLDDPRQSFLLTWLDPRGRFTSGHEAIPLDNALAPLDEVPEPPPTLIFEDGFETGDLSSWSVVVP